MEKPEFREDSSEMLKRVMHLARLSWIVIRSEGAGRFVVLSSKKVYYRIFPDRKPRHMRDVLFIAGSRLPQVERYRVSHQIEQLQGNGMTADITYEHRLSFEDIKYYRGFVFCRYPHTEKVEEFIGRAKSFNKTIIFEIDDLIFDTEFTDNIATVQQMDTADRTLYDSGVKRSQQTLRLCDYAITTTAPLSEELKKYKNIKDVFVNRNVASDEMLALSQKAIKDIVRDESVVTIGYFSGSITHNEDFELVVPHLIELMEKYENIHLHVVGILDSQSELARFSDRITTSGFIDWRELPTEIRKCDINLAPLAQKSIFNDAKSEIKWLEASLVKTVTIASDFGAFNTEIADGVTGVLVGDDSHWVAKIEELVLNPQLRERIAQAAYDDVVLRRTTLASGKALADWLTGKFAKNVAFVVPSGEISGGVNVILKHADILRKHGYDVTIINNVSRRIYTDDSRKLDGYNEVLAYKTEIEQRIDEAVATLWATLPYVRELSSAETRSYFVQNFETDFLYPGDRNRMIANSTYCYNNIKYTTMSLWCKEWLRDRFSQDALYASNGLWSERYQYKKRDISGRKIKILIEGDPHSEWKNVDEAFRITNQLDRDQFEINFLSYYAEPKDWYIVDNFHQKVPSEIVGSIYQQNDILLKTSLLESFSYPPLEMIATGGFVVVIPNGGNLEYLVDEENCLMFDSGDDVRAIEHIKRIVSDKELRERLDGNGKKLVARYSWESMESQIVELYK
jgi:glycosyltransferase involved in cell wall biosynthesis